jgi:hypothetical protein
MNLKQAFMLAAFFIWQVGWSDSWAAPSYPEPSEQEMRRAIERAMVQRGGTQTRPGEISVDNPINGMTLTITSFTKLGCEPAIQGPGYVCSYHFKSKMGAHSNEGTQQGDKHAAAVNKLLQAMMGGREEVADSATRRFLRMGDEWIMSKE